MQTTTRLLLSVLEHNHLSLAFHKKICSWFTEKLKAAQKHRMKGKR